MKRRDILSLRIICEEDGKKMGFVKELMLKENEFVLSHYIVNDNTLENTFILPIEKAFFEDGHILIKDTSDMIKIDSLRFYNEMIRNESYFTEKNVIEEEDFKALGKAIEYSFDTTSGELLEILYIDTEKGCISSIPKDRFLKSVDTGVLIKKEAVINQNKNISLSDEDRVQYELILNEIIEEYREKIIKEHDMLNKKYFEVENEIIKEFDNFISYMRDKRENFFTFEIKKTQDKFLNIVKEEASETLEKMENIDLDQEALEDDKVYDLKDIFTKKSAEAEEGNIEIDKEALEQSDRDLQRLFELQRKRADIVNKL